LTFANGLPALDMDLFDGSAGFGVRGGPFNRLDLAVRVQGADDRLANHAGKRHLQRTGSAREQPAKQQSHRDQQK
jgi:hypothetical protein